jgi:hypothetical protein
MMALYQLARGAGHSVLGSLGFALFNWPLPTRTDAEREKDARDYLARVADLDRRSREQQ